MPLHLVPLTLPTANRVVDALHRHHPPIPPGFAWFCVGVVDDGVLRGAAIAGRPTNRNNDDGFTVEVLRVATDGVPNGCSALLGACRRAARALGASRIITYTLDEESGSSLRAVGWVAEKGGITSWWTHEGTRTPGVQRNHSDKTKVRWASHLGEPVHFRNPYSVTAARADQDQLSLDGIA